MAKKYYWLKLQKDFFKRHDIRVIESMENGKDYILFYMKLLVESISHEGQLRFSDTIPYDEKMLATITNTNIDIVRSAIKIFTQLELMSKWDNGTIFMSETQKMIGVETEWAKKKRDYREKKQLEALEYKEDNVLSMSDKSKSKSLEIEKENNKYSEVLKYLNDKLPNKRPYTLTNDTKRLLSARYNEGFIYDDFISAIDNAYNHWSKTGDYKNMKPSTLFNGKFESRVNDSAYDWESKEHKEKWRIEYAQARRDKEKREYEESVKELDRKDFEEIKNDFFNLGD